MVAIIIIILLKFSLNMMYEGRWSLAVKECAGAKTRLEINGELVWVEMFSLI